MVQRTVLQYQLGEKIGGGGMGEIYKARDTRLNRIVAVKVLSAAMSGDPDRRRRFVQEAQAVSALNHPNIITIFDIVDDGETQYMVVEYVDGKTLVELIPRDGMPLQQVLRYATQLAEALCAAHAAGIIHRDLKPANIMVTGTGLVKVLDFGLAKLIDWPATDPDGATVTMQPAPLTIEGTLLGTVNYMSPEQAEGKKVDARSDIFSFGAVLYEMLTGRHAFQGDSVIATLTAVLRDEIQPVRQLSPEVPAELERIVGECLKKNPDERAQSMADIQAALAALARQWDSGSFSALPPVAVVASHPPAGRRVGPLLAAIVVLAAVAGGAGYWWVNSHRTEAQPVHTETPAPPTSAVNSDPQPVTASPVTAPAQPIVTVTVVLGDATPVPLTLTDDIPGDAAAGTPVQFKVSADVRVNDTVVIRKGAVASGVIVDAAKKKFGVLGSKMTFSLDSVDAADGQKVPIRATSAAHRDGISKHPLETGASKSKNVASAAGTAYKGFVVGPKTVTAKK